ncbi:MAG TPA: hypothetical protein VHX86_13950 [Tepidisphaeraceae bacterium]|jgi:hypothetical protein|nr:hypothetical protein [Tepidisphaeraceae bacterium]
MSELRLYVPTYYGQLNIHRPDSQKMPEFGDPSYPVLVRPSDGVRIVLGSHDFFDLHKPDIQIERRPNGWAIFLHPLGGSDASGYVYFLDDGRSFLVREICGGPTPILEIADGPDPIADLDQPAAK